MKRILAVGVGVVLGLVSLLVLRPRPVPARLTDDAWSRCGPSVAHALGGIDSFLYTNSREAFLQNYAKGFRVFEVDFRFTRDSVLVAAHDWETAGRRRGIPTVAEFRTAPIYGSLTPLTAGEALDLLVRYPGTRFVLDPKDGPERVLPELVRAARHLNPSILDRMVPQVWHLEDVAPALQLYPWPSIIWTLYASDATDDEVVAGVARYRIGVVTMSEARFHPTLAQRLRVTGVAVYVHTVNTQPQVKLYRQWGASGVYTDFLPPDSLCPDPP